MTSDIAPIFADLSNSPDRGLPLSLRRARPYRLRCPVLEAAQAKNSMPRALFSIHCMVIRSPKMAAIESLLRRDPMSLRIARWRLVLAFQLSALCGGSSSPSSSGATPTVAAPRASPRPVPCPSSPPSKERS